MSRYSLLIQFLIGAIVGHGFFGAMDELFGKGVRFVTMLVCVVAVLVFMLLEGKEELKYLREKQDHFDSLLTGLAKPKKSPEDNIKHN